MLVAALHASLVGIGFLFYNIPHANPHPLVMAESRAQLYLNCQKSNRKCYQTCSEDHDAAVKETRERYDMPKERWDEVASENGVDEALKEAQSRFVQQQQEEDGHDATLTTCQSECDKENECDAR